MDPLGLADCEQISDGLVAQPIAAFSSGTYIVAALFLLLWLRPRHRSDVVLGFALVLLALIGVGSIDYHGPQTPAAPLLHDLPIGLLIALLGITVVVRLVRRLPVLPGWSAARLVWLVIWLGLALLCYWLGRTSSAACDPESLLQWHSWWHVLSALALAVAITMVWGTPSQRGQVHPGQHRVAQRLARAVSRLVYREVEVYIEQPEAFQGPTVAVANHFGGLADGVLLVDQFPRMPRIVARDLIWKVPVVGKLMTKVGGIPVHRAADGAGQSNQDMFRSTTKALSNSDLLLIFPEGVTQDVPHIAPVKTGAARIALTAAQQGVAGVQITPVGVHYQNKAGFRSRVLVHIGAPISVDNFLSDRDGKANPDDREQVRRLTGLIEARLSACAPNYPDWATHDAYTTAAEVVLNDADSSAAPQRYGDTALIAGKLHTQDQTDSIRQAALTYLVELKHNSVQDLAVLRAVQGKGRPWSLLWIALVAALLLPYAVVGLLTWVLPLIAVGIAQRLAVAPAVRATLVPALAAVAVLVQLIVLVAVAGWTVGWEWALVTLLVDPLLLFVVLYELEAIRYLWQVWTSTRRPFVEEQPTLQGMRQQVSSAIGAVRG